MQRSKIIGIGMGILALLVAGSAAGKLPRNVVGKVFFSTKPIQDQAPKALVSQFSRSLPKIELKRGKDKHWNVTIVGFFSKPSVPGPITIWLYDKADKASLRDREPVNAVSVDARPREVFIHDLDINPDLGFNKGYTYLIQVGQIIGKRNKVYAHGEVTLNP